MNIREATKNDCVHMDALLTKLIRYEARFDPNLSPEVVIEDNYAGQIAAEGCKAYVAEDHGIIVGYLYGFTYRIPQVLLQPIAIVDALYVEEGYRGKGIAKDLFRKFQEFASGCGAASIELKVMSRNRDALRLYASLGFCETKKIYGAAAVAEWKQMTFFFNNNETGTGLTRKGQAGSCFVDLFALYAR